MVKPVVPLPFEFVPDALDKKDVKSAAKGFEAILWEMVLKEAFKTVSDEGIFSGRGKMGIYNQIMLWELSNYISKNFETDIGRKIYEKFSAKDLSLHPSRTISNIDKN